MKLIDLLVQELPKHGGWPEGVNRINQAHNGVLEEFRSDGEDYNLKTKISLPLSDNYRREAEYVLECGADIVTHSQYEAALASLKQPKWNGEGLPPVGALIEVDSQVYGWVEATVTAVTDTYLVAQYKGKNGVEGCMAHTMIRDDGTREKFSGAFRPIRDKAERHRDEALKAMREACTNYNLTTVVQATREIYDAIAAGKIKGIMLKEGED